jgi:CheY-like chemotaxis protein
VLASRPTDAHQHGVALGIGQRTDRPLPGLGARGLSREAHAMKNATCVSVLVVNDDENARGTIASFLRAEGFHVFSARDAEEALERLSTIPRPTLMLVDLMIPLINGWSLVGALQQDDRLATLPVVLVAEPDPMSPEGYRHIKKPIPLDALLPIVHQFCLRML